MVRITKTILLYVFIICSLIASIFLFMSPIQLENGVYVRNPQSLAPFELRDHQGQPFDEQRLKGHWSLLFFGFSSCPMICPVTLDMLQHVNAQLSEDKKMNIIFVSVDPEHDTVKQLHEYMQPFDSHFTAATGKMNDINSLQRQLHVSVSTTPSSHGTDIILINPQAQIQAYFIFNITSQELLEDLHKMVDG